MAYPRSWKFFGLALWSLGFGLLALPLEGAAQPSIADWATFAAGQGATVQYPRGVFPIEAGEDTPPGPVFTTADGRARLHIFTIRNERGETPAQFLKRVFPKDRARLAYDRVARNFFAVSERNEGRILYRRCNFPRSGMIHCVDIRYPLTEKRAWDDIVTRISLSLRPR